MSEMIDKAAALDTIRSFICSLRPEATGLISDIYDAVNHLESVTINDTPDEIKVTNCNDMISRQALLRQIDIDADGEPGYYGDTWKFIDTIKMMPSAQPEPCDVCRYNPPSSMDGKPCTMCPAE